MHKLGKNSSTPTSNKFITSIANVDDNSKLWHFCLRHTNYGSLRYVNRLRLSKGLPYINPPRGVCDGCVMGKVHRESFPNDKSRHASKPHELIHNDIDDPMATTSLKGAKYSLTFNDDYSWFL